MPGWEYIQTFMMAGHSSMQVARVAMEVQLRMYQHVQRIMQCKHLSILDTLVTWIIIICFTAFIDVVLRDAKHVQAALLSLMQNDTFAKAWADHAMDSIVQTVAKVG